MAENPVGLSRRERARINAVLGGPEPGRLTWWRLWVAGSPRVVQTLEREAQADAFGLALRATVRGAVPRSARRSPVLLDVMVDGIPVRRFTGRLLSAGRPSGRRARVSGDSSGKTATSTGRVGATEIRAASSGGALGDLELGSVTSFDQTAPSVVVRDALGRGSGRQGPIFVEPVDSPRFTRKDAEAFSAIQSPAELLENVGAEVPAYEFWDTAYDGHRAFLRRPLEEMGEPEFVFDAARLTGFDPLPVESRVSWVVVFRRKETFRPGEDPNEILARVPVPGSTADDGAIERIETSDTGPDAPRAALQTARDRAREISGRQAGSFVGPLHPLIDRGSCAAVLERGEDELGRYAKTWSLFLPSAVDALPGKRTTYSYEAKVRSVRREIRPDPPPAAGTAGVVRFGWGRDAAGAPRISASVPWADYDPLTGEAVVYPEIAARHKVLAFFDESSKEVVIRWNRTPATP